MGKILEIFRDPACSALVGVAGLALMLLPLVVRWWRSRRERSEKESSVFALGRGGEQAVEIRGCNSGIKRRRGDLQDVQFFLFFVSIVSCVGMWLGGLYHWGVESDVVAISSRILLFGGLVYVFSHSLMHRSYFLSLSQGVLVPLMITVPGEMIWCESVAKGLVESFMVDGIFLMYASGMGVFLGLLGVFTGRRREGF